MAFGASFLDELACLHMVWVFDLEHLGMAAWANSRPFLAVLLMEFQIAEQAEIQAEGAILLFEPAVHHVVDVVFFEDNCLAELMLALRWFILTTLLMSQHLFIRNCFSASLVCKLTLELVLAQYLFDQLVSFFGAESNSAGTSATSFEDFSKTSLAVILIAG